MADGSRVEMVKLPILQVFEMCIGRRAILRVKPRMTGSMVE